MATSPLTGNTDLVTYKILTGGVELDGKYQVSEIEIEKEVNKIATARIVLNLEFDSGDNKTFKVSEEPIFEPGKEIEIQLGYHVKETSLFKGLIVNIGFSASAGRTQMIINCCDKAVKMTFGRKSKYFNDKKDSEILSSIIREHGLTDKVDITSRQMNQMIQYNASDWDFVCQRAKVNGMFVYTEGKEVLVKKPGVNTTADLVVNYGSDVIRFKSQIESRKQMIAVKSHGWSMSEQKLLEGQSTEPSINKQGSIAGKRMGKMLRFHDYEQHSSGALDIEELKEWSNGHLLNTRLSRIYGDIETIGTPLAKLNTLIDIEGFGARMNGSGLITRVFHRVAEGTWSTTIGFGLSPENLNQKTAGNVMGASGLLPSIAGMHNGKVKKIDNDPDGETRILVDIPVIGETGDGIWARLSNLYATNSKGAFFMPEVDDEVVVGFLNNDPRFPVILGSLYSSKKAPPYTPDEDNSIKAFVTKNDLKLEFNDKDKIITMETPGGNKAVFSDKDKSILLQDRHGNKLEMSSRGINIDSQKEITIKGNSNVDIKSTANIKLDSSAGNVEVKGNDIKITANMNLTAKGNMNSTFEAGMNATVKSGLNMTIQGVMVMIN